MKKARPSVEIIRENESGWRTLRLYRFIPDCSSYTLQEPDGSYSKPEKILKTIKSNISTAKERYPKDLFIQDLKYIEEFEKTIDSAITDLESADINKTALTMFRIGRLLEQVNAMPIRRDALKHASRNFKSGHATAKKYQYFSKLAKDMVLSEASENWSKRGFVEQMASRLCQYLIDNDQERIKAGLKTETPSMEACRKKIKIAISHINADLLLKAELDQLI